MQKFTDVPVISAENVQEWFQDGGAEAIIEFAAPASRTFAEDLLIAYRFRGDTTITAREFAAGDDSRLLASPVADLSISDDDLVVGKFTMLAGDDRSGGDTRNEEVSSVAADSEFTGPDEGLTMIVPPYSTTTTEKPTHRSTRRFN